MTFYLGGSNLTSQPYFGSSLISKIYKGASLLWEYLVGGDPYEATNSLDFQPNDYLVRTPTVVGNRKTWTFSTWVKRTNLSFANGHIFESAASPQYTGGYFNVSNQIQFRAFSGGFIWSVVTNETVADAQWHHLVFTYDSTQATEADRIKVYLDGTATTYASATYPALNADSNINNTTAQYIGTQTGSSGSLQAYLADVHMIDGQALDATSFAESSAIYGWQPKEYSGSYGTNGFHLKFIYANKPGADIRGSNDLTWNGTGSIEGFGPTGVAVEDPYFNNVALLLHMDGTNGSTTFTDESNNALTVTTNGNTQISTTESKFGGASGYFDGNGDYLQATLSSSFNPRTDSWTIESWIRLDADYSSWVIACDTNSKIYLQGIGSILYVGDATINNISIAHGMSTGVWHHMAATFDGTTYRAFRDGTLLASSTTLLASNSVSTIDVGGRPSQTHYTKGYIDDVRITPNVARYTTNFIPQNAPFADSAVDPYFNNVSLLLPMDGTNGSTTFTDESNNALTVTANGDAQITTTDVKYGSGCALFDGTGDYLEVTDPSAFYIGTGDYTVELWVQRATTASQRFVTLGNGGSDEPFVFYIFNSELSVRLVEGSNFFLNPAVSFPANTWFHVAVCRDSTSTRIYMNGTLRNSTTNSIAQTCNIDTTICTIGRRPSDNTNDLEGKIDGLRITKGVARYTSNFTPPSGAHPTAASSTDDPYINNVALLLHMNGPDGSTIFTDNSSNALAVTAVGDAQVSTTESKFGGASAYFDGSGDYLSLPDSSVFTTGTDDFTIECWYRPVTRATQYNRIFHVGTANWGTTDNWALIDRHDTANTKFAWACWAFGTGGTLLLTSTTSVVDNTWYHLAVTRSGSTFTLFVNGVAEDTYTNTGAVTSSATTAAYIGGSPETAAQSNSYIDDLRWTPGVARYTSNFVPQDAPFEDAVTDGYFDDVVLLLHGDGTDGSTTVTDDSVSAKTVTPAGSAVISTTQSKFGGSSLYFPGTTADFMSVPDSADWEFGTGDVTVEAWIYIDGNSIPDAGGNRTGSIVNTWTSSGSIQGWTFMITGDSSTTGTGIGWDSWDGAGNATQFRGVTTISQQTWHHVAATVEGGTRRLFLDGTLISGTTNTIGAGYTTFAGNPLYIGKTLNSGYPLPFNGYIDDLRITKGVARYTTDFTPPTAPFPNFS